MTSSERDVSTREFSRKIDHADWNQAVQAMGEIALSGGAGSACVVGASRILLSL